LFQDDINKNILENKLVDTPVVISNFNWIVLITICLGSLMVVIDETIVNIALPSIRTSLNFSDTSLAWVVNSYLISFGGFLLLMSRIGDIYGFKKLFLLGIASFTFFSITSGFSNSQQELILSRVGQGISGAIISAISLSLIVTLFKDTVSRAKAMGVFAFVLSSGGSIGVLLGGVITNSFGWNWIFFINIPVGILVFCLSFALLPDVKNDQTSKNLDIIGSILITSASLLAVYGIVNGNDIGWFNIQTLAILGLAIIVFITFIIIENQMEHPLIPTSLFKLRNLVVSNIIAILWAAAMFAWFFLSALYMQLVLNFNPFEVGIAFLPANIIMALCSISISDKLVIRFGIVKTACSGLFFAFLGLVYFSRAPVNGSLLIDILPSMLLLGFGGGIAFNPLLLASMNGVDEKDSGLASGLVNMSFVMGGALGLAILASTASVYTKIGLSNGLSSIEALNSGYSIAFFIGSLLALLAVFLGYFFLENQTDSVNNQAIE
jgi:EmrB/QacA subfamily drug resistance transporter